jgi:MFS family permease
MVVASVMLAQSFFQFTIIFGVGYGFCNGIAYTVPLKICWDIYPEQKGMVSGVIICGFGVGSFIFSFISTMLVNPLNIKTRINYIENGDNSIRLYGDEVALKVPYMIIYMCILWSIICCFGILLLKGESSN